MKYKGDIGHFEYENEAGLFHGDVVNIRDVITFQGEIIAELEEAFHDSVDDYLAFCQSRGEKPARPII